MAPLESLSVRWRGTGEDVPLAPRLDLLEGRERFLEGAGVGGVVEDGVCA